MGPVWLSYNVPALKSRFFHSQWRNSSFMMSVFGNAAHQI
jgi:hypothetical protein